MGAIDLEYIKKRRKLLKISQFDMAVVLGFSSASGYNPYEMGKADFSAEHLPMVAKMLECRISDLYVSGILPNERSEKEMLKHLKDSYEHLNNLHKFLRSNEIHDAGKNFVEIEIEQLERDIASKEAFGL